MPIIGSLAVAFVGMTMINRVLEGQFITASDVSILNTMTIVKVVHIAFLPIPVPNLDFLYGIWHLVSWDYSYFGGNAQIIQFFLYSITFFVAFSLFILVLGISYNLWNRAR